MIKLMSFLNFENWLMAYNMARYSSRRKKNTRMLGALWCLLEPLALFMIFMVLRNRIGKTNIPYYPVYLYVGLVGFQFFTQATRRLMVSLHSYSRYTRSFPLPLDIYIISTFLETLSDVSWQLIILLGLLVWQGLPLWTLLPFILFFLLLSLFSLGGGCFLVVINVYFRDMEIIWGLLCRILFFATPVFYLAKLNSIIVKFNPLASYLYLMRDIVIEQNINWLLLGGVLVWTFAILLFGVLFFSCFKKRVVEML